MLIIISPAKKLDFNKITNPHYTTPRLLNHTNQIIRSLKQKSASEIGQLMHLSEALSLLNYKRYQSFDIEHNLHNAKPALFTFAGDVYSSLSAKDFTNQHLLFAQQHLRVLSGLYGLLRPFDLIQAHRLEMGTKLSISRHANLYSFWQKDLTALINHDIKETNAKCVINLASKEYSQVIDCTQITVPVVNIHFRQHKGGELKNIGILNKKARGKMANFIVNSKINKLEELHKFQQSNYIFQKDLSDINNYFYHQE